MYSARFDAKYDDSSRAQTETWLVIEKDGAEFLRTPSGFYSACSDQEDALVLAADALNVHEATGLTPSQLQARVAELEAALAAEREACAAICDEMAEHWSAYKDSALLNGDIELSNTASGEPRAAAALASLIRGRA